LGLAQQLKTHVADHRPKVVGGPFQGQAGGLTCQATPGRAAGKMADREIRVQAC
jgi:hypothetical protein